MSKVFSIVLLVGIIWFIGLFLHFCIALSLSNDKKILFSKNTVTIMRSSTVNIRYLIFLIYFEFVFIAIILIMSNIFSASLKVIKNIKN